MGHTGVENRSIWLPLEVENPLDLFSCMMISIKNVSELRLSKFGVHCNESL